MKSEYEHRRDAHGALVDALAALDDSAMAFCAGEESCTEENCDERGFHTPAPHPEFMENIEAARNIVKDEMISTLAAMMQSDPVRLIDE